MFSRVTAPLPALGSVFITDVEDGHDHLCFVCREVGELIVCDRSGCTLSFHLECAGLQSVPEGNWLCDRCSFTSAIANNPIDSDGHHKFCVECGQSGGEVIMCDAIMCPGAYQFCCPRSYHFSCVGLSNDSPPVGTLAC